MAKRRPVSIDIDKLPRTREEAERLGMTGPKAAKRMRDRDLGASEADAQIERRSRSAKRGAQTRREARPYSGGQRAVHRVSMVIETYLREIALRLGGGNFTRGVRLALIEAEERRAATGKTTRESVAAELARIQNRLEELQGKV